jgi:hypothetical protein
LATCLQHEIDHSTACCSSTISPSSGATGTKKFAKVAKREEEKA